MDHCCVNIPGETRNICLPQMRLQQTKVSVLFKSYLGDLMNLFTYSSMGNLPVLHFNEENVTALATINCLSIVGEDSPHESLSVSMIEC